jgi:hypothetical protein
MKVVPEYLLGDMTDDLPNGFLTSSALGQLRNQRVAMVVPPACHIRSLPNVLPRSLDGGHVPGGIRGTRSSKGKDIPLRSNFLEFLPIPRLMIDDGLMEHGVDWNRPPFSSSRLALPNLDLVFYQVNLAPRKRLDLRITHASIESHGEREMDVRGA